VIYSILIPGGRSGEVISMLRTGRTAASVFPVAVGEINSTFLPSRILGMVFSCGSDGEENPLCSISRRIGLTSKSKALFEVSICRRLSPEPEIQRKRESKSVLEHEHARVRRAQILRFALHSKNILRFPKTLLFENDLSLVSVHLGHHHGQLAYSHFLLSSNGFWQSNDNS
jgi:hypothetical protein